MPKGISAKGYKMTENRKQILGLLVEEGDTIKSSEGRATSLMHGLLDTGTSMASLNASLKELENIGFIRRRVEGRRTYEILITNQGKKVLGAETAGDVTTTNGSQAPASEAPPAETPPAEVPAVTETAPPASGPVSEADWDWQELENDVRGPEAPGGIDYDILLGVFLKAAIRGMEGPVSNGSSNGEIAYYKQQIDQKDDRILQLEEEVNKFRAEAAHAIAERDQLQKNFNLVMSRAEGKGTRGSNPIRNLLRPEELGALDALMRQLPTTRGE